MLGAIIGDIVGSRFEFNNHKSKDFELFTGDCFVTDDSIMTLAVAKAIMEAAKAKGQRLAAQPVAPEMPGAQMTLANPVATAPPTATDYDPDYHALLSNLTIKYMQEIGRRYPNCGFGGMFYRWVFSDVPKPYHSFGNGAAMRVSPAGFAAKSDWNAIQLAKTVTAVTHNHVEGIKGATATAVAIYLARRGALKSEIRARIVRDYYPLDFLINDIRPTYRFNETCQETVPQAIECFLESTSFEDAIRMAVSLGGDSDTIAAITGAIAEAYYGVPSDIKAKALTYLNDELLAIYNEWTLFAPPTDGNRFKVLTKYIAKIEAEGADSFGHWNDSTKNDALHDETDSTQQSGTPHLPLQMPYVEYSDLVTEFESEFYCFAESHPEYQLHNYHAILTRNGLEWSDTALRSADVQHLDEQAILALIMGVIRAERFCEGVLLAYFKDGYITKWLKWLAEIDR